MALPHWPLASAKNCFQNDFQMQIWSSLSDDFPVHLVWGGSQRSQVNNGPGYDLVAPGNTP